MIRLQGSCDRGLLPLVLQIEAVPCRPGTESSRVPGPLPLGCVASQRFMLCPNLIIRMSTTERREFLRVALGSAALMATGVAPAVPQPGQAVSGWVPARPRLRTSPENCRWRHSSLIIKAKLS